MRWNRPFPVDSRPGRVTARGFRVLDGRRLETRLQPACAGVASACSGKAKWKSRLTLDYGERGREAVRRLLGDAQAAGLLPKPVVVELPRDG